MSSFLLEFYSSRAYRTCYCHHTFLVHAFSSFCQRFLLPFPFFCSLHLLQQTEIGNGEYTWFLDEFLLQTLCSSQLSMVQHWLSSPIFPCSFVRSFPAMVTFSFSVLLLLHKKIFSFSKYFPSFRSPFYFSSAKNIFPFSIFFLLHK